jgi:response regulator NasT
MNPVKILLCMSNETTLSKIKKILSFNNFTVIDQARDGQECLKKFKELRPDIILMENNITVMSGIELSKIILKEKSCDIMLMISEDKIESIKELKYKERFTYMVKPINKYALVSTTESIVKHNNKVMSLEKEIKDLKYSLVARKEIEKAKGLLMKNLKLTEPEAFKKIQKQSMDKGLPMMDIAKAIIIAYDI